jgi:hypothetical protein
VSGFGSGTIRARFIPDEEAEEADQPRFWESSGDAHNPQGNGADEDAPVQQCQFPARWPEAHIDLVPPGLRPGERPGVGQSSRLLSVAEAARAFRTGRKISRAEGDNTATIAGADAASASGPADRSGFPDVRPDTPGAASAVDSAKDPGGVFPSEHDSGSGSVRSA